MIVVDKQKYKMAIDEAMKEVRVQVHGFLKNDVVEEYLADLQVTINKVPKQSYTFVIDSTYQSPVPSKVAAEVGQTMMFYASFGFKNIVIIKPKSKIAQVQLRNALEQIDFPGTFEDAASYASR